MKITVQIVAVEMNMASKIKSKETEQYFQRIEKFLNYEDEPTMLFSALEDRVLVSDLRSLTKPEQIYYAINHFYNFLWNEGIPAYFKNGSQLLFSNVSEGFALLKEPAWIKGYEQICDVFANGAELSDEDTWESLDYDGPFIDDNQSLPAAIDAYAERHGLLRIQVP